MKPRARNWLQRLGMIRRLVDTEQDCLWAMQGAWFRLHELGWRDIIYCPKDGTVFLSISAGSVGIHDTYYAGDYPDGTWWVIDGGETYAALPILFKSKEP